MLYRLLTTAGGCIALALLGNELYEFTAYEVVLAFVSSYTILIGVFISKDF